MALEVQFLPLELNDLLTCTKEHKEDGYRLVQMLCTNTEEGIDMQYSFMLGNTIKNFTIKGVQKGASVPSITESYLSAFVFENEAHDLFGVEVVGNLLDFGGKFYILSESEPMTVITPEQKAAREKAAKIAAAKAAKEAAAQSGEDIGAPKTPESMEDKLEGLDPEKAAKVKAAMEAKAAREATKAADASEAESSDGKEGA